MLHVDRSERDGLRRRAAARAVGRERVGVRCGQAAEREAAVATRRQVAAAAGNGDTHRSGRLPVVAEVLLVAVVAVHGSVSGPSEAHDRRSRPARAATGLTTAGRASAREAILTRGGAGRGGARVAAGAPAAGSER